MKARAIMIAAYLAAAIALSAAAHAQGGFGPPELTLVPVKDNIYMIRNAGSGNVTMLVGKKEVILVDAKFPMDHDGIMKLVRQVTDLPVRYIINTHMHPDHAGGNPAMQDMGADVIASQYGRQIMAERGTPGLPNIVIDDYLRIYLDDMPLDLHYYGRGHTESDIVVYLPTERMLIAGDLFALYGPYRAVIDYTAGGSLREWTHTLDKVLQLDFDMVIPGHSGLTDRKNVEGYKEYLANTQEVVRMMVKQKKTRDEIKSVLETQFNWGGLEQRVGLDGVITEMQ
ncbi:MAG TPA: MBL fold metallo-hydrolase [Gammaproteobacteria bacterium]|nr:MBL fold metallo-hydrolase [Gammaproteobacteria bacterium]